MRSVLDGELDIVVLALLVATKQRILFMCFGIIRQQRKFELILSQLINNTYFSLGLFKIGWLLTFVFTRGVIWSCTWVRLFTDGAVARDTGSASTGGVLCDQLGNQILGFNHYLERCTPFEAELWGILDSLLILLSKDFKRAMIQIDNPKVVRALQDNGMEDSGINVIRRV
ncbi:hypothetical protein Gohar_008440 [Gossypium harknessii]|uniref:RNase H type-1 domain-containing protein n=1 Tax=Gossypium harknessii TaxID=34285 RepID=A0A7J9GJQ3_9ROSI|nr:hypothetical protein [Gossypium harknessii]